MQSKAATVSDYLDSLPADRRAALEAVRKVFRDNLDPAYSEGMSYGMIGYCIPHSVYPAGYHCDPKQPLPYAGLASQKNHMSLYLMCVYGNDGNNDLYRWFTEAWKKTGKKLDMGRACCERHPPRPTSPTTKPRSRTTPPTRPNARPPAPRPKRP